MEVEKRVPLSNIQSISKSYDLGREKVVADPYDTVLIIFFLWFLRFLTIKSLIRQQLELIII